MPLLYADDASKEQQEREVKTAVWCSVDAITSDTKDTRTLAWSDVATFLKNNIREYRNQFVAVTPPVVAQPAAQAAPSGEDSLKTSSSSGSSSDSSSSGDSASDSEEDETASAWAEFAHGSGAGDRIHFLTKGRLPGCAKGVHIENSGYGAGTKT